MGRECGYIGGNHHQRICLGVDGGACPCAQGGGHACGVIGHRYDLNGQTSERFGARMICRRQGDDDQIGAGKGRLGHVTQTRDSAHILEKLVAPPHTGGGARRREKDHAAHALAAHPRAISVKERFRDELGLAHFTQDFDFNFEAFAGMLRGHKTLRDGLSRIVRIAA